MKKIPNRGFCRDLLMTGFTCIQGQRLPIKGPCTHNELETKIKKSGWKVWENVSAIH